MKKQKQLALPGIPKGSDLHQATQEYIGAYGAKQEALKIMEKVGGKILTEMAKAGRTALTVQEHGITYKFSVTRGDPKIKIKQL